MSSFKRRIRCQSTGLEASKKLGYYRQTTPEYFEFILDQISLSKIR
jgi:hypothetical protein